MDLPDSDWGDFSCRRAVDSSSYLKNQMLVSLHSVKHYSNLPCLRPVKIGLSCKHLCLLCSPDPWCLPGAALFSGCQSSWGANINTIVLCPPITDHHLVPIPPTIFQSEFKCDEKFILLIQILVIKLLEFFKLGTTPMLSCVLKFVAISLPGMELKWNKFSIKFELWCIRH